jgi:hypothetical protein
MNDLSDQVSRSLYRYVSFAEVVFVRGETLMQLSILDIDASSGLGGTSIRPGVFAANNVLLICIDVVQVVGVAADEARPLFRRHGGGRGEAKKSSSPSFSKGLTSF